MRYLTPLILRDLKRKAVFLSGPRQVGKSTEAKELIGSKGRYYNWDIAEDRREILSSTWPRDVSLVVLDELHKKPKWKNYLKGVIDSQQNKPPLMITGSARLETFYKAGDALTGRSFHYHLHPIDVRESRVFLPKVSLDQRIERLLTSGGFPESYLNPADAKRLLIDRLNYVLREDLRDIHDSNYIRGIELLIDLLRERVGNGINYSNLAQDIGVSAPTVKQWIEVLERLYIIFVVTPFSRNIAEAIRKEPRIYFYDCSASTRDNGARLENLVACALLKYCDLQRDSGGRELKLHYFRDKQGHEVDFVITENRRAHYAIEVKTSDDELSSGLRYFAERLKPATAVQLVRTLRKDRQIGEVKIQQLGPWLEKL